MELYCLLCIALIYTMMYLTMPGLNKAIIFVVVLFIIMFILSVVLVIMFYILKYIFEKIFKILKEKYNKYKLDRETKKLYNEIIKDIKNKEL